MYVKLAETENELLQIIELQNRNHFNNVTDEERENEGFVTVQHDIQTLTIMNNQAQQIIAIDNEKVVGYALVMLSSAKHLIPILTPMFETFESIIYHSKKLSDHSYYAMGQVCIAKSHRGKGVFKAMYSKHKEAYSSQFNLCLTEVSSSNLRSMNAHKKIGFKTIHTFKDLTDEWNILLWDWN